MLHLEANDRPGGIYTLGNRGLVASVAPLRMPMRFLMLASKIHSSAAIVDVMMACGLLRDLTAPVGKNLLFVSKRHEGVDHTGSCEDFKDPGGFL